MAMPAKAKPTLTILARVNTSLPKITATISVWMGIVARPTAPLAAGMYCNEALKAQGNRQKNTAPNPAIFAYSESGIRDSEDGFHR